MNNINRNNQFINKKFDEFSNTTVIAHKDCIVVGTKYDLRMIFNINYIKTPELEAIALACTFTREHWFFARDGEIIFNCDQENISANFIESGTEVSRDGDNDSFCNESGSYIIPEDLLKKICAAEVLKIRVRGEQDRVDFNPQDCQSLQKHCRQFYNNVFDANLYENDLVAPTPIPPPKTGGCFIATAAMGSYDEPSVMILRSFRDSVLLPNPMGVFFVNCYYKISPPIANWMIGKKLVCELVKRLFIVPISKIILLFEPSK